MHKLSRWERGWLVAVALAATVATVMTPIVGRVAPQLAVDAAVWPAGPWLGMADLDPWGRP